MSTMKGFINRIVVFSIALCVIFSAYGKSLVIAEEQDETLENDVYIGHISFLNDEEELVTELTANDFINIWAHAEKDTSETKYGTLIAAVYDSKDRIVKIEFDEQEINYYNEYGTMYRIRFKLPEYVAGHYIKVMFWDSLQGLKSLNNDGRPVTVFPKDEIAYYGYLTDIEQDNNSTEDVLLKVLTENNGVRFILCEKILKFNGNAFRSDLLRDYLRYDYSEELQPQLIKYKLNSNGKIHTIYTAEEGFSPYDKSRLVVEEHGQMPYNAISQTFNNYNTYNTVAKETKVFFINKDYDNNINVSNCFVGNISDLRDQSIYDVEIYDFDSMNIAKAIVVKYNEHDFDFVSSDSPIAIVDEVISEGEEVKKLIALYDNEVIEKYAVNNTILDSLQRGDVIQFNTDFHDRISAINILCRISDVEVGTIYSDNPFIQYDIIVDWREDIIALFNGNSFLSPRPFLINNAYIYLYDISTGILRIGSQQDIEPGSTKALIRCRSGVVTELLLVKE